MDGVVLNSEVSPRSSVLSSRKIPVNPWSLGELGPDSILLGKAKERKGPICQQSPTLTSSGKKWAYSRIHIKGKVEVIPSGLIISNKIGQPFQSNG